MPPPPPLNVAIIGAGAAALTAARTLLASHDSDRSPGTDSCSSNLLPPVGTVTIVEANSYVGGRIKSNDDFIPGGNRVDLGAEIVHGFGTMLTDVIEAQRKRWQSVIGSNQELLEEIYIASHADGGPAKHPTKDGKYGVYYLAKENRLLRFDTDDADFCRMSEILSALVDLPESDSGRSLADHFEDENTSIPQRMIGLLASGYSNTAGCTDLGDVSLNYMVKFEKYWEENEEDGDARLHPRIAMAGIIDALRNMVDCDDRCSIRLNWTAERIQLSDDAAGGRKVIISSSRGEKIVADKVIITAPPPVITSDKITFMPPLPQWKLNAYNMVGMERAVKVILRFSARIWPEDVQTVISDLDIPECWFRDILVSRDGDPGRENGELTYLAVCFLTSKAANAFMDKIDSIIKSEATCSNAPLDKRRAEAAAEIIKDQLARVFSKSCTREEVERAYVSSILYDWSEVETIRGGYMYPKVGIQRSHFLDMARSLDDVLYFAGEATNMGACCTVQAAMETGLRAANDILGISYQ